MQQAGDTPGGPADAPGDGADGSGAGLGARLVALGGLELGDFDAVSAAPGTAPAGGPGSGRTRTGEVASRRRTRMISALVLAAVLGFFGTAAYLFVNIGGTSPAAPPPFPRRSAPSAAEAAPSGPRAADQGVRGEDDLHRVCEDRFYPSAPGAAGAAPHPVVISESAGSGPGSRSVRTLNRAAYAGSAAQRRTWAPEPGRAQLVACLDLTGPGGRIRDCPSGSRSLPLLEGRYRLTVHEIATRRTVIEKNLTGADRACPFVILSGTRGPLHSAVKDQQLYDLLRRSAEG